MFDRERAVIQAAIYRDEERFKKNAQEGDRLLIKPNGVPYVYRVLRVDEDALVCEVRKRGKHKSDYTMRRRARVT